MDVDVRFRALPLWMMLRPSQLRASAAETAMMVPSAMALAKHYAELKVPAIVMSGTQDLIADFSHNSERLNERIPESELRLQPGVGHMTHYAHPDQVVAAVDAIAARVGEHLHMRTQQAEAAAVASNSGV
jgi:pimeloyl-ACP methyl ester carboxylesterase